MTELPLSDKPVQKLLETEYGYIFVDDDECGRVFLKITEKSSPSQIDPRMLDQKNALQVFIGSYYDITGQENNFEYMEDFKEHYENFCKDHKLQMEDLNPE